MGSLRIVKLIDPIQNVVITGGIVPMGEYAAGTDYAVGDMVSYTDGNSYVMYVNAAAGTAPTDDTKWMIVAEKGDTGASGAAASISDTAYGASWNGVTDVAPSKNAVYDKIETIAAGGISESLAIAYSVSL